MNRKDIVNTLIPTLLVTATGFLAGAWVYGLRLHIGHDAAQYIGMLHRLAHGEWNALSYIWPPGFPLLGLPFVWAGWPADMALFTVQLFSFATIAVLAWFLLNETGSKPRVHIPLLLTLALAPVMHSAMYDFRSELPFAALILILVWIPRPWNNASRAIIAALLITCLFLIRYVGIAFTVFPALAWFFVRPRQKGNGRMAVLAMLASSLLLLLYIAAVAEAPVTGYALADFNANLDVLTHVSEFGLSFLGIVGIHAEAYFHGPIRTVAGLVLLAFVTGFLAAGIRSKHPRVALLSLAAAVYTLGIIGMRSMFWFDPLSGPRFAIPVLPALIGVLGSLEFRNRILAPSMIAGVGILLLVQIIQLFR